ncbi:MAG TPA: ATP-binding protein [Calditrichia bacterium]|nr:PAS domain S-box protein [Calditrichota bacterium]HQU71004.1 ATP-binding protein [Calditrichia bacterium]HQV33008.1 ATP-binding protein [Calditrichia bacterium]
MNSRIINEQEPIDLGNAAEARENSTESPASDRLINQIFHFHKSIIQHINAGLITIDLQGRITFANRAAAELLKTRVADLLDAPFEPIFESPEEARLLLNICDEQQGRLDNLELRIRRLDGQTVVAGITAAFFQDKANQVEGIVLLFQDVTELHHLRRRMEQMERMALLGELSAGIAHEIRNPLAGIKAATQVLEDQFPPGDLQAELMRRVIREVDKANALLKEFFKFARPARPEPALCRLADMVDHVRLLLEAQFKKKEIDLRVDCPEDLPAIFADDQQVEQVLINLFLNAMDVLDGNGVISVNARRDGAMVRMTVADNGPGISAETQAKIFNPFFTTKSSGVGLGLSICSRLVSENGGTIEVESETGRGTRFHVRWPTDEVKDTTA